MTDSTDPKSLAQQVTQQTSAASGDGVDSSAIQGQVQKAMEQGQASGLLNSEALQDGNLQDKVKEAMAQGQESGLLSAESLQDGSLQDKVKEAMEKGQAPGGFLSKFMGGEVNNPLSSYGNDFGNTIEEKLSPVGNVMGKGLGAVGSPVGGVVEPLLGGVMKSGSAFGSAFGVGAGNMDKRNAAEAEEREKLKQQIGGKEPTGDNPLGL